ncbi:hypothetical protein FR483_n072L [Paramecium bursaria Chlorella virus FR483]|uniref:Uncharacterized protein n072L n=1 Tax=Paramecium bursaria Chlorella virus FR483 TaxID=399781 RepID=A7J6C6_PBCVF|nr:hypothetical protein FR483_n072L [Paramecium bursaria Chlorella virus FR483]ABT15357.1 hypothetical protein FR483_n072L [Paramecium bursaria Chlorella virus FR483]
MVAANHRFPSPEYAIDPGRRKYDGVNAFPTAIALATQAPFERLLKGTRSIENAWLLNCALLPVDMVALVVHVPLLCPLKVRHVYPMLAGSNEPTV